MTLRDVRCGVCINASTHQRASRIDALGERNVLFKGVDVVGEDVDVYGVRFLRISMAFLERGFRARCATQLSSLTPAVRLKVMKRWRSRSLAAPTTSAAGMLPIWTVQAPRAVNMAS